MQDKQPIATEQLPQCQNCNEYPAPQSAQHILLLILQIGLLFLNWKISIILLMVGYSFPVTHWKCPICSRYVSVSQINNPKDSVIIRLGKCLGLFSLNKFRIAASLIIIWMIYLLIIEVISNKKKIVTKSWRSMALACGYELYMENSVRSTDAYLQYLESGSDWNIEAIYLYSLSTENPGFQEMYFKMDPSQFKDPQAPDFKIQIQITSKTLFKIGDLVRLKGQWRGRTNYIFIFNPLEIMATGQQKDPAKVGFLYEKNSLLQSHLNAFKPEYEKELKNMRVQSQ